MAGVQAAMNPYLTPQGSRGMGGVEREDAVGYWNAGWMDAMWEVLRTARVEGQGEIRQSAVDRCSVMGGAGVQSPWRWDGDGGAVNPGSPDGNGRAIDLGD